LRRARGSSAHLSRQQEADLITRIQAGDREALGELLLAHRPMLEPMAALYARPGIAFEDLMQEGFAGLMRAAERFTLGGAARFGTYGKPWARKRMLLAVKDQSLVIRVPVKVWDQKRWDRFPHVEHGYPQNLFEDRRTPGGLPRCACARRKESHV